MLTLSVQFLDENRIFPNYLPFNWIMLEIKCSADQILTMKSDFVSFDHLWVAIGHFQTTDMFANLPIKKIQCFKDRLWETPL